MGLSHGYGPATDRRQAVALVRAAFERGVIFFDTAQLYGAVNEEIVGEALEPLRGRAVIAAKFGFDLDGPAGQVALNSRPEYIRKVTEGSLVIHQDVRLYDSHLSPGREVSHTLGEGRHAWLQVVSGSVSLNGPVLGAGDGAAVSEEGGLRVGAEAESESEFLLFDLA